MSNEDVTPVRRQYLEEKKKHPDAILFFRLGDCYETFDEDAEITARELDIVLTSRPIGGGVRVPLAGIPYHAVENYLSRLIEKGYHVAICEQIGEVPAKGLVERKVVRVVTPGTVTEPGLLPGDANNYLASFIMDSTASSSGTVASVAYTDFTTGEFAVTELPLEALRAELTRLHPAEILYPDNQKLPDGITGHTTSVPAWKFEPGKCNETLLAQFKSSTLDGFGLKANSLSVRAAGAIIQYLKETQPDALNLLNSLRSYSLNEFMTLDASTRRNLELDETLRGERKGSLLGTLDATITPMGKRMIHQWVSQPLLNVERINKRQNGVEYFVQNGMVRAELRAALKPIADLERLINRVIAGQAQPRDLMAMRSTIDSLPNIVQALEERGKKKEVQLPSVDLMGEQLSLLQNAIDDDPPATLQNTGVIRPGYSAELDGVIDASKHAREWIANLEAVEREKTGIKTLKVGYNKVFGYYIEISRGAADKAPEHYIRKQTLVNAERFITPEMKEYETLVLNAEERIKEIETRLFKEVCADLAKAANKILSTARAIAELDVLSALGEVAALNGYTKPQVHDGTELEINEGRHPVVEQLLKSDRYVPNDVIFEKGEIVRVITGPNMSGKSTYLRQAALIVLMAQMGSFVPAASAKIGLVDRIFTRIGAQDEIHAGQSTFMVEMVEAANILHHATSRSLLILDEIGRGTSTYDGLSIAWGIIEYIHNHPQLRAKTLFATHYHELTQLAELLPGVRNYNVAVSEADNTVVFLHKIIAGGADKSYGIHVAQLAGLPSPVIGRANEIMMELERSSGRGVKIDPNAAQQAALFPETNPLLDELKSIDVNSLSPIEALNKLFEWQKRFGK
ncbi:MAG: DNA mismatch repair protein MutS [Chloroflexota bacterium]